MKKMKCLVALAVLLLTVGLLLVACDEGDDPKDTTVTDAPATAEPVTAEPDETEAPDDEVTTDGDVTEEPATEAPTASEPETNEPETNEPVTDAPHEHVWGDWTEDKAATCTEQGSEKRTCACGESESREVAAKGHTEVVDAAVAPTCTETGLTEGKHCSVCGTVLTAQETVAEKGHTFANRECVVCGEYEVSVGLTYASLGNNSCYVSGMGTCTDSYIIIPETAPNGETVVGIGERAFANSVLTDILIPDTVKSIGAYAFENCTLLVVVILPEGVTEVQEGTFSGCTALDTVTLPDSVTSIGNNAFQGCERLESMDMPEKLESIGNSAFENCRMLIIVILPEGLTSVGNSAFAGCTSLETVKLPDSLTSVGDHAFKNCESLTALTLPAGLVLVGEGMIDGCKVLVYIYVVGDEIPEGVQEAVDGLLDERKEQGDDSGLDVEQGGNNAHAFKSWVTITAPTCTETGLSERICGVCGERETKELVARGHTEVIDPAVEATCTETGLTEGKHCSVCGIVLVKQEILATKGHHFVGRECEYCHIMMSSEGLLFVSNGNGTCYVSGIGTCIDTDIVIPSVSPNGDVVTEIGLSAFANNKKITSVVIPEGVTEIKDGAFQECTALTNISIPNSVISIGRGNFSGYFGDAFYGCTNLTGHTYGNAIYLGNEDNPYLWCYKAIDKSIETIQFHEDTCGIMHGAFYYCKSLDNVIIPNRVIFVGGEAFGSCSNLKNVKMSQNVMTIGSSSFSSTAITTMELPNTVTEIGASAFYGCKNLKTIIIPESITEIYRYTFANSGIESIAIHGKITKISEYAFYYCSNLEEVFFSERKTPLFFESSVFEGCTSLESIDLPEGIGSVYPRMFAGCKSLKNIVLPRSVTKVSEEAFYGCTNLESVVLPDNVWAIAYKAFMDCSKLTNINIPAKVSTIVGGAFENCTSLTSVVIPYNSSFKTLGAVFTGCINLSSVTIHNNITKINGTLFLDCTNLTDIYFKGTKYQWKSITKAKDWNKNTGNYTVHCTDGDIPKS